MSEALAPKRNALASPIIAIAVLVLINPSGHLG
jgi:hypothetical protein